MSGISLITRGFVCQPATIIRRFVVPFRLNIKKVDKFNLQMNKLTKKLNIKSDKFTFNTKLPRFSLTVRKIDKSKLNLKKCD